VVDRASGGFGLYFRLGPLRERSASSAEISVEYAQGGLWGRGWRCEVELSDPGAWQVLQCVTTVHR
jgi:hypothetical protein